MNIKINKKVPLLFQGYKKNYKQRGRLQCFITKFYIANMAI